MAVSKVETLKIWARGTQSVSVGGTVSGTLGQDRLQAGSDGYTLSGQDDNDYIRVAGAGTFTKALSIGVALRNAEDARAFTVTITGVPEGATLSKGVHNDDGSWTLKPADLKKLKLTSPDAGDFTLTVTASSTDGSHLTATKSIHFVVSHAHKGGLISGGHGNDTLIGGASDDTIYGSSQTDPGSATDNDRISAYGGHDNILSGNGADTVTAGAGNDTILGGDGNDRLSGDNGNDHIEGEIGNDALSGGNGDDVILGGAGGDAIRGNAGNDTIDGGVGNNRLFGDNGNDVFKAGGGNDQIQGGWGNDTIDFSAATQGVTVNLATRVATGFGTDHFQNIENIIGSQFADVFVGDRRGSHVDAGAGDDTFNGRRGGDVFTGGAGADVFNWAGWTLKGGRADHITDFSAGDVMNLSALARGDAANLVVANAADGAHVSVLRNGHSYEVAVLDNYTAGSVQDMIAAGLIVI